MKYLEKVKVFSKVVVVNEEGRVLALKRQDSDCRRPSAWDLPGGNLEVGEEIHDSVRREVLEETGLEIGDIKPLRVESSMGSKPEGIEVVVIGWWGKASGTQVRLSSEHKVWKWVRPEEFRGLETGDDGGFLKKFVDEWARLKHE